ncbi:sugar phosphate isomerase/epimerase family protein [Niabella drilacis]|uniref:Sugar phosphate isomerase/epimerase n=1 Tax=Niabella drilacis (strain DSM 25811 / CCM 8410 / CCUG 62505 / LMG 26954 / E90) TaxID=1285928 RepID=A0A1G6UAL8_NIADE|nr:sugar phosphate isomerase/epimerase [Niabella drilacis]SDD37736.1 Sugar phosphate isomerase/epimerase [Niabella drilacis]
MLAANDQSGRVSRRDFLKKGSIASLGLLTTPSLLRSADLFRGPGSKFSGVQIGVITYSFRSMPGSLQEVLQHTINSGVSAVELMGEAVEAYAGCPADKAQIANWRATVSMDKFKAVKKMFDKAGIKIYAFKPNALGSNNTDAEIEYAMRAAKTLGATSVTVELPRDPAQTERLGKLGAKHKVYVGYHAHTQATDTLWDTALEQSPYNSMNLDCGHYIAVKGHTSASLLALIRKRHDRITSMHIKDRQTAANGGENLPWGEGDTPIKEILTLLKENKYKIPATIELEYRIPAGSDAVQEVKKCLDYARKALQG